MQAIPYAQPLPPQYLAIEECRSGEIEVIAIGDDEPLDLECLVDRWIYATFDGELQRAGELMPKLPGDYYAWIQTDSRPLDSVVVWETGGFYVEPAP